MFKRKKPMTREERAAQSWSWDKVDVDASRRARRHQADTRSQMSEPAIADGGKAIEAVYENCSASRLYAATARCVSEMGYAVSVSDRANATISFRTGMRMKSWQGQEMTASISTQPPASARVVVGGRRLTQGYQLQVFDWGEAKSIARKLIERLTPLVAVTPEPSHSANGRAALGASTADELERVSRLHQQGLLTDQEFTAAKRKLLE